MNWQVFLAAAIASGSVGVKLAAGYYDNVHGFIVTSKVIATVVPVVKNSFGQVYIDVGMYAVQWDRSGYVTHQAVYLYDQWHTLDFNCACREIEVSPGTSIGTYPQRIYLKRRMNRVKGSH